MKQQTDAPRIWGNLERFFGHVCIALVCGLAAQCGRVPVLATAACYMKDLQGYINGQVDSQHCELQGRKESEKAVMCVRIICIGCNPTCGLLEVHVHDASYGCTCTAWHVLAVSAAS